MPASVALPLHPVAAPEAASNELLPSGALQQVPFNRAYLTGNEFLYTTMALGNRMLCGDGPFTRRCNAWLESRLGAQKALLTHSCTAALEMAAILADLKAGDEVIMPSYTFVSTANAFVLRGAVPVFVDIRTDTKNIDETLIEAAITLRTRAIVPVHYAGVACEMDTIMEIARRKSLLVIEDAAQGIMAEYRGRSLGTIGDMGTLSFHETKNVIAGEGGALLLNRPDCFERAEVIREKGTNRKLFYRGQVDKYTWTDIGSSYLPGELVAAFLQAQLEEAESITRMRQAIWNQYDKRLRDPAIVASFTCPTVPAECRHNAHMYYLEMPSREARNDAIVKLAARGITAAFHYVPLHSSAAGRRFGRAHGPMTVTDRIGDRLLRLPLWAGLDEATVDFICTEVRAL